MGTYEEGKTTFIRDLVLDFLEAARLAQMPICPKDLFTELLEAPHKPGSLPARISQTWFDLKYTHPARQATMYPPTRNFL